MSPNPSPSPSPSSSSSPSLQFVAFQPSVDEGFWHLFASLKLDTLKTDDSPIPITGFYAPCSRPGVSNCLTLLAESLPLDVKNPIRSRGNRNRCPIPGTLYNTNTLEDFNAIDTTSLLNSEAKKILEDMRSGRVEEDCALLSRFLVLSFADLKKHSFRFLFGFPALVLQPPASLISIKPAMNALTAEEAKSLSVACNEWRNSSLTTEIPFFLISIDANSRATIRPLKDWQVCQDEGQKLLFGFYDPCHLRSNPGWPLRNFLTFICLRWKIEKIRFFCYREKHGFADLGLSLVGEALVSIPQGWSEPQFVPEATGWERHKNKLKLRCINLAESMDPVRLANSAADLNLKLMKWRALPSLSLDMLYNVKCLILGAGALGCQVARMLMAWGVRNITLVDSARVSLSNPLRQSLYLFDDSLNGGDLKAVAAARRLKSIFPAVQAEGIALEIPRPGYTVPSQDEARVIEDCEHLQALITSHDVIFLMTDTRESRWLPTVLCASENKIAITAALGFDDYLVIRHGAGPTMSKPDITSGSIAKVEDIGTVIAQVDSLSVAERDSGQRLGCCFCTDAIAAMDSAPSFSLDQQCMVSRPGLAPIASALAVELTVGILHHPDGINASGDIANSTTSTSEQPLGVLPHQIQGSLPQLSELAIRGYSSNNCTACSIAVVSEYRRRGMEFILQAINSTYLENIAGLGEPMKLASSLKTDMDTGTTADVTGRKDPESVPESVGQESNRGTLAPQCFNVAGSIDSERLAASAADLHLSLMKHALPSLNLYNLSNIKCLLLGAGTLGCQVARMLMAWGVRKITLLDKGHVAMSNPVRQSLYTFEDCLNQGSGKALAAARSLKHIMPSVEAKGIELAIPMPGHPISSHQEASVLEDCKRLQSQISSHDVIFLLTDTRESRWLPALLCASENKICINAALGFDSYLVMRHGAGPIVSKPDVISASSASEVDATNTVVADMDSLTMADRDRAHGLGCYFCNDVVAPIDSISNRTLDQQCTVTRPGLAPIAAALAVELMVGILYHPNGLHAPGEIASSSMSSTEQSLGILPHQIRGSLSQFSQMTLVGYASNSCTACCNIVVSEYKRRGLDFVVQAINHPTYLEDLTGLTELKESASSFEVDWDNETDDSADDI